MIDDHAFWKGLILAALLGLAGWAIILSAAGVV